MSRQPRAELSASETSGLPGAAGGGNRRLGGFSKEGCRMHDVMAGHVRWAVPGLVTLVGRRRGAR
jgi:hypothetical protein